MRSLARFPIWILFVVFAGRISISQDTVAVAPIKQFSVSAAGTGLYRPDKWGVISLRLTNPLDTEIQVLASTHFVDDPTLQYGRRVWLPPNASLATWHPIKMPIINEEKQKHFEFRTQVLNTVNGTEMAVSNEFGSQQFEQAFLVAPKEPVTALIGDMQPRSRWDIHARQYADSADFVLTARCDRGLKYNFTLYSDKLAPAGEELLDTLDHLIVGSDRLLSDAGGIGAIRRWVTSGGRLWIMADKVSPELLGLLMGDDGCVTEVDRVDLSHIELKNASGKNGSISFSRDLERPAQLVRMVVHGFRTLFSVDGWPAAFCKPYGHGEVYVTTLGADGWLRPRTVSDQPAPGGSSVQTEFVPGPALSELALHFFISRPPAMAPKKTLENHVRELVGYSIPERNLVLGILLGFTGMLFASGLWLGWRGHLEQIAILIPIISIGVAGTLIYLGWSNRSAIPASSALIQIVQAVPGTDDARMTGMAGVFSTDTRSPTLAGLRGGWMMPQATGFNGAVRRLVWTDIDQWSWEKHPAPPGLEMVAFQTSATADVPLAAFGTFGPTGISGLATFPPGLDPKDAIIATPHGRLGVDMQSDGRFQARGSVLGASQFLSGTVLSDEQQRRNKVLSVLLDPDIATEGLSVPTLFFWTKPWRAGMSLTRDARVTGSALVSIPLEWRRPTIDLSQMMIPAPLLPFREVMGPDGRRPSGLYDLQCSKWAERTGATGSWLAFTPPKELLPLHIKSARITFKVLGPMGRLEVSAAAAGRIHSIKVWNGPVGTLSHEITDTGLLQLDQQGRLLLRIDAGQKAADLAMARTSLRPAGNGLPDAQSPESFWQFEAIMLELSAEIPPQDARTHRVEAAK